MADVSNTLVAWSNTTASNSPSDTTTIGSGLADNLREIQGVIVRGLSHKGADIASDATTDLGGTEGLAHDITGTTTITSFGTGRAGLLKILQFDGALTLTHNGTSLVLPGGADIVTAAGDVAIMFSEGSGNWRCYAYFKAASGAHVNINGLTEDTAAVDGSDYLMTYDASASLPKKVLVSRMAGALSTEQATTSGTSIDFTSIPSWVKKITVQFVGVSLSGTSEIQVQLGDSGGVETTGYTTSTANILSSATGSATATSGFIVSAGGLAANTTHGTLVLTLEDATNFTWVGSGITTMSNSGRVVMCAGSKSTSAALDRVRITTVNGTDTFDAGAVNILYE